MPKQKTYKYRCSNCGHKTESDSHLRPDHCGIMMSASGREDKRAKLKHPMQPFADDGNDIVRFKQNKIVRFLLDNGPYDVNQLAIMTFSREDREQFAQLIGYSVCGFGELGYTRKKTWKKLMRKYDAYTKKNIPSDE